MNELILDKKIYVSSKRAAEMTGYAKDYIGQMCREGRIEARLVGRNWYVLKSGLEEHRFSADSAKKEPKIEPTTQFASENWEKPHYEIESFSDFPSINRLSVDPETPSEAAGPIIGTIEAMQDAWKGWFTREDEQIEENSQVSFTKVTHTDSDINQEAIIGSMDEDIPISIHPIESYSHKREALNLRRIREYEPKEDADSVPTIINERMVKKGRSYPILNITFAVLAVLAIGIAYIGSGFINAGIVSYKPLSLISGVYYYNK